MHKPIVSFDEQPVFTTTAGQFLSKRIAKQVAIISGLINEGNIILLSGDTGGGKSWLCLHIAYCIAAGKEFLQGCKTLAMPVLYVDGEMGEGLFQKRLQQIQNRDPNESSVDRALENLHILGKAWSEKFDYVDAMHSKHYISKVIAEMGVGVLILDNLDTLCPEALSKPAAWKELMEWVQKLSKLKVAVLLIHHNNKKGDQYGSSVKTRQMNIAMTLRKTKEHKTKNQTAFTLTVDKDRDKSVAIEDGTRFVVKTSQDDAGRTITQVVQEDILSEQDAIDAQVKAHFLDGKKGKEISALMGISAPTISRIKNRLAEKGGLA